MAVQTRRAAGLCGQLRADDDGCDGGDDDSGGGGGGGGGGDDLFSSLAPWLVFLFLFFDESLEALDSCDHSNNQLRQWGP